MNKMARREITIFQGEFPPMNDLLVNLESATRRAFFNKNARREKMEKLVVTRYKSLVAYLKQIKLINDNTKILTHAKIEDVKGKHVIGVLPYWLACHTGKFTEVQLRVPSEKKGQELTLEEVEFYSLEPKTYVIQEVSYE